ncbi:hypothetical protein T06_16321, partial [Trichinella sp. T6]
MTRRRRDRASEEEPAKSDDGLTGADPEEAIQMTSPSGSLQRVYPGGHPSGLDCSTAGSGRKTGTTYPSSSRGRYWTIARRLHNVSPQHFDQEGFHLRSLVVGD